MLIINISHSLALLLKLNSINMQLFNNYNLFLYNTLQTSTQYFSSIPLSYTSSLTILFLHKFILLLLEISNYWLRTNKDLEFIFWWTFYNCQIIIFIIPTVTFNRDFQPWGKLLLHTIIFLVCLILPISCWLVTQAFIPLCQVHEWMAKCSPFSIQGLRCLYNKNKIIHGCL